MLKAIPSNSNHAPDQEANSKKLRLVVLESPYDNLDEKLTQELFSKLVALKIKGYRSREYAYGVLPVDATDYVATHFIVCKEENDTFTPLYGQRSISLRRCQVHHLTFPLLNLAQSCKSDQHSEAIRDIVGRCEKNGVRLSYESSVTIHPDVKNNPELLKTIRGLLVANVVLYHRSVGTEEMLGLAAVKFKIDRVFTQLGFETIKSNGQDLTNLIVPSYDNAEVKVMHHKNGFPKEVIEYSKDYLSYWNERIWIRGDLESENEEKLKAA